MNMSEFIEFNIRCIILYRFFFDIERSKDIFYPFQDANPNDAPGMLGHNYAMEPFSTIGAERVGPPKKPVMGASTENPELRWENK